MIEDNLCFAVYAANHAFTAAYRQLLDPLGLTYPQYLVLLLLLEQEGVTVTQLGRRLQLDSGTLTPLLKRMAASGLVTRTRDAEDERQVRIGLLPAGRALRPAVRRVQTALTCLLGQDADSVAALRTGLVALTARLREAAEPGPAAGR